MAVRAYLPDSAQAWVVDPRIKGPWPMRPYPSGRFVRGDLPDARKLHEQSLPCCALPTNVARDDHDARPLCLSAAAERVRPAPAGRGPALEQLPQVWAPQLRDVDGVDGVNFAVWAPNATGVSVIGDFNGWDARRHAMRKHIPSGIWELFVPGLGEGTHLQISDSPPRPGLRESRSLRLRRRAAAAHRLEGGRSRPLPLARLGLDRRSRSRNALDAPMSIYEVHSEVGGDRATIRVAGSTYRELAHQLVDYCQQMGYTHLELMPGQRASVLGQLGLPDGRLLRRHQPLWLAARLHVLRRSLPPERHRRVARLGARPLPARRSRPADVRRHAPLRTCRPAARRASRLGHVDLQLRPQRSSQLLDSPTRCSGSTSITSTACASMPWPR